jgi:hypothetical protein
MRLEPKECRPYCAAGASPWRNRQSNDAALTLSPKEEKKESPARGSPGLLSQRIVVRLHDGGTSGIQLAEPY